MKRISAALRAISQILVILAIALGTSHPVAGQCDYGCDASCTNYSGYQLMCTGGDYIYFTCDAGDCEYVNSFACPNTCSGDQWNALCDIIHYCENYEETDYWYCYCN